LSRTKCVYNDCVQLSMPDLVLFKHHKLLNNAPNNTDTNHMTEIGTMQLAQPLVYHTCVPLFYQAETTRS